MKLSKRGEYALRALIDLGIASEFGWPMLQISELASKEKLPIKFLEQIFTQLKSAGYVASRRGKFGGYSLARPMGRIKFGAVIASLMARWRRSAALAKRHTLAVHARTRTTAGCGC